jgi:hypothetical protein
MTWDGVHTNGMQGHVETFMHGEVSNQVGVGAENRAGANVGVSSKVIVMAGYHHHPTLSRLLPDIIFAPVDMHAIDLRFNSLRQFACVRVRLREKRDR